MKKILCALLVTVSVGVFADDYDYQLRTLYYSANDNLCRGNADITDKITIDILLNNEPFKQYIRPGAASCSAGNIIASRSFTEFDSDAGTNIPFAEEAIVNNNKITGMKTTLKKNVVSIDGNQYKCTIKSNGTSDRYNDAVILLNCED